MEVDDAVRLDAEESPAGDPAAGPSRPRSRLYTSTEVQAMMTSKADRDRVACQFKDPGTVKSGAWDSFKQVFVDGHEQELVQCVTCRCLMRHTSGHDGSGTGSMRRHLAVHAKKASDERQPSIRGMFEKAAFPAGQKTAEKQKLSKALAIACALDIRPISMCEGDGFAVAAQAFVNLGAAMGAVRVKGNLIPSRETVRASVMKLGAEIRGKIQEELADQPSIAATTDHWTDEYSSRSYKAVTVHYITADWQHRSRVLTMSLMSGSHTGDNIWDETQDAIQRQFGYTSDVYYVTDNAANMKRAFRDADWTGCVAHSMSLAVKAVLQDDKLQLGSARAAVRVCKKSGISAQLSSSVKQTCPTRWNSELNMLESLLKVYSELEGVDKPEVVLFLRHWKEDKLRDVIDLLKFFGDATRQLEGDGETSHLVAVMWQLALKAVEPDQSDSPTIRRMKVELKAKLGEKLKVSDRHLVTSMLHPMYRELLQFTYVSADKRADIRQQLVTLATAGATGDSTAEDSGLVTAAPSRPRKRPSSVLLLDDLDAARRVVAVPLDGPGQPEAEAEVDRYINTVPPKVDRLVEYWRTATQYPLLQKLARRLLPIPATNAATERVNSLAGRTIEDGRTRMAVELADSLVLIKASKDMLGIAEY